MRKLKQIADTGTIWQSARALTLIIILIFLPQQMKSQEVSINQEQQTVTLTKEKTIDVAKIIRNEKRLTEVNKQLLEKIRKQDSTIQALANKNLQGLETIKQQNAQIFKLSQDVQRYSSLQLGYEEKKKANPKLYGFLRVEQIPALGKIDGLDTVLPSVGATYLTKKIAFGANIGYFNKEIFYGAQLGFSIF